MRRGAIFWGTILVIVGILLLADNLGLLGNVNIWGLIWPLFLIMMGVWIILGRYLRKPVRIEPGRIPLGNAEKARVRFQHGAGRLYLGAGAATGDLLSGEFGGGIENEIRHDGAMLAARVYTPPQIFPFFWIPGDSLDWNVRMTSDIPLELVIETGASESKLDFSNLQVTDVRLKSGAASADMILPAGVPYCRVGVESGAASVDLHVPADVAAHIHSSSALSSINVDTNRFPRQGDVYESLNYATALHKVEIDIQMGVGSINIHS